MTAPAQQLHFVALGMRNFLLLVVLAQFFASLTISFMRAAFAFGTVLGHLAVVTFGLLLRLTKGLRRRVSHWSQRPPPQI